MRKIKLEELKKLIEEMKYVSMNEIQTDKRFLTSIPYEVKLKNGMIIKREKLIKGGTDGSAAIILPIKPNGDVILTVEPRVFTETGVGVSLPAGYINPNEEASISALRELEEETGCTCDKVIDLGGFYQDMGCSAAYNRLFMGINAIKTKEPHFDKDEIVTTFECGLDEAFELIDLGYIKGCNAIITLERAKKYKRKYNFR